MNALTNLIIAATLSLSLAACAQKEPLAESAETAPKSEQPTSNLPPAAQTEAKRMLDSYDTIHGKLAADSADGVAADAAIIEDAATKASGEVQPALQPRFLDVASAAAALKTAQTTDLQATRKAFGEVSSKVVALLSAEPSLVSGRFIFECPMTPTYKKWVQTNQAIANPYYGKEMLECGEASKWKV